MTPSMGMAAPKGVQAPAAGLGALAKPAQAPKGKSPENMGQIMALARKMSDMQLADVLSGKSLDVPQYVAMTEAMGRKQLRTAMQGQQAMAQGKQPSLKDRLMAEQQTEMMPAVDTMGNVTGYAEGGITSLPAPNMDSMDMAAGGIVAFDEGGEVPRFNEGVALTKEQMEQLLTRGSLRRSDEEIERLQAEQPYFGSQRMRPYKDAAANAMREAVAAAPKVTTEQAMQQDMENAAPAKLMAASPRAVFSAGPTQAQRDAFYEASPKNRQATLMGTDTGTGITPERRKNPFEGMKAEAPNVDRMQSEGLGIGMMQAARALLKNPSFSGGIGDALGAFADQGLITKKELRDAKKDYRDFNLNSAKAEEAFQQGQDDLGQKYQKMAQDKELGLAQLAIDKIRANKEPDMLRTLKGIAGNPQLEALYSKTAKADVLDRDKAATLWEKLSRNEKANKYGNDFETYYKTMNNQLLSATIPGQGANVIGTLK